MFPSHEYLLNWYCGESTFNFAETIDTNYPVFSPCQYNTILYAPLLAFIIILTPIHVIHLAFSSEKYLNPIAPCNLKLTIQLLLLISLLAISTLQLVLNLYYTDWLISKLPPVVLIFCISKITAFIIAILLSLWHRSIHVYTSASLSILSLYYVICSTLHLTVTCIQKATFTNLELLSVYIQFALSICNLVSQLFSTAKSPDKVADKSDAHAVHPVVTSSFFSRLTYQWVTSLILRGWKQGTLTIEDLFVVLPQYRAAAVFNHVHRIWMKRCQPSTVADTRVVYSNGCGSNEKKLTIQSLSKDAPVKKGNIFMVLVRSYGLYYFVAVLSNFALDACVLTTPIILRALLGHLEKSGEIIYWHGYFLILGLFGTTLFQSLLQNFTSFRMLNLSVVIRSSLVSMIYRKSLRITNAARSKSTVGEIVNLMSVDADRFTMFMRFGENFFSAPIRIVVSIYFIYQLLGPAVFAGVSVIIILIPTTSIVSKIMQRLQAKQMKTKDQRIKLVNEVLSGIRVIKLYAWEKSFTQLINDIRTTELNRLRRMAYFRAITTFMFTCTPMLVAVISFATYTLLDSSHHLNAQKAFVSLAYFNIMRMPMMSLPNMVIQAIMIRVSIRRINNFLNLPEMIPYVTHDKEEYLVRMTDCHLVHEAVEDEVKDAEGAKGDGKNGKLSNDGESVKPFELKGINMQIKEGSFIAIVGTVGSGKSSLVSALLGEMELLSGSVNISPDSSTGKETSIAYVPQQAWIQNDTIKNNILFGEQLDEAKYRKIVSSCQLLPDLQILTSGDATEIGEKGINLSGGQKQRLSLARACYSDAQLYILDDPLSAVDAHVAKHLYNNVLSTKSGLLGKKTRILVTNDLSLLPKVDRIFVISNGTISESGTFDLLMSSNGKFAEFVQEFSNKGRTESTNSDVGSDSSRSASESRGSKSPSVTEDARKSAKLIADETMSTGRVKFSVYISYVKRISLISLFMVFIMSMQAFDGGANYWLSMWASDGNNTSVDLTVIRLSVYSGLGFGQVVSVVAAALVFAHGSITCAARLHGSLLDGVLRAPMSFFDTTPIGRVVNRFSKDLNVVDESLPNMFYSWFQILIQSATVFAIIVSVTYWFAVLIIPVSILYFSVQRLYIPTNRQLRRILSVTRSPLYSNFSETLTGVATIRAYSAQSRFILDNDSRLDTTQRAAFCSSYTNCWLSIRLQFIGNCVVATAALFAVLDRETISPALAGLSITYASSITGILTWFVMITAGLETDIIAVERILEYSDDLTPEAELRSPENSPHKPPALWPKDGAIEFRSYSTRYRENLPLVLDNIDLSISAGEHVGIVGRTGAGKSSITLALFRLIEPTNGTILIDGIDIRQIGLHELREAITIIPQDPVLFSGKLRTNLDPFDKFTDEQLWRALQLAHLKDFVHGLEGGLDYHLGEGGCNLSVGQRQLICLARALLKNTKILILDEATAAVDMQTDSLIQSTVRSEFSRCTILTIAHRLNTILDSDRILVLDEGHVAEFASPASLLADNNSKFYALARDAGVV